ncbi:hypothetical protein DSL64_11270 [Dyadobacter luteus]|uniref:Histidine kinase domain-containing protein n=1 Tax=Dyadobacter luteus TaxID=2259619 RepID=A0A3D8YBJ9_9BACT|nr:histidine kinase dimerization/phosphoacceptor domain -containing protein [Dyadobacter luteus]REA61545.1 hypothetical protein DSL64_11270 [Dyadobacter luteus]
MTGFFQSSKRQYRLIFCLILAAFLVSTNFLSAQVDSARSTSDYIITKRWLSIEDGLASHEVFCGVQDDAGFLWFGTRNGLNRYDGGKCLLLTRQRNQLQDNKVVQLAKDDVNRLFVMYGSTGFQLTTNGKVDVVDATSREVKTLSQTFKNLPFREKDVYWVANDGTDDVIFLTASPFRYWRYSAKKGFRLKFEMKDWNGKHSLIDYRQTGPFSTFIKGLALLKFSNADEQYLVEEQKVTVFRQRNVLRSLPVGFTDENELLITYNHASNPDSFKADKLTNSGQLVRFSDFDKYHLKPVKGRYWYQVWTATAGEVTAFYDAADALYLWNRKAFVRILEKSELKGFENLFIYRLFSDKLGNIWLCTSSGVMQLTVRKNRFETWFSSSQQKAEQNPQVRGIYAEHTGNVIANLWTHTFFRQNGRTKSIEHSYINYALAKHNSKLYTGSYNLSVIDPEKNSIIRYPDKRGTEIWSMYSLNDSLLLLGRSDGFFMFNSVKGSFDSISTGSDPEAKFVYRFFRGNKAQTWAVAENGLYQFENKKVEARNGNVPFIWSMTKLKSSFLDGLTLLDAWQDANGVFWLATNGEGLYSWNPVNNESKQFNITAGFPSDVLYRIEPDDFGNLWVSSDYGLTRFNRSSFAMNTYTTLNGISHNEFNRTSSFRAGDGRLFFGGLNGVNGFDPKDFKTDSSALQAPLKIVEFNQFVGERDALINKTTDLIQKPHIILDPDDLFFTLDFQLIDFTREEGHRYAYRIEGLDHDWNYINENSVRISGLPYGHFVLHIKAQNREGIWNERELTIPIDVLRPFYLQWWFILIVVIKLVSGIYLLVRLRLKRLAKEKRKLEQTVSERTAQLKESLSEQSALLLEKDVLMKEIHHRVKNNLQVISGLLELQSKTLTDEKAREALQEGRNRVRSIALIHQNLYQFENISTIDLKRFIDDLSRQVYGVFQSQKSVSVQVNVPPMNLDMDTAVPLGLILNELLTNSFKYAFKDVDEGRVQIDVSEIGVGTYALKYSDNGGGLPAEYDMARTKTLGLQLVNDLSRQVGGKVLYETNGGARFTINFTNREVRKNID